MKRQLIASAMIVALTVVGVLNLGTVEVSAVEPAGHIYISPASVTVAGCSEIGSYYNFSICSNYTGTDVIGYAFKLTYDPYILHGFNVTNGDDVINETVAAIQWYTDGFDNDKGELGLTGASFFYLTPPPATVNGTGILANVTFEVVGCGTCNIDFVDDDETHLRGWDGSEEVVIIDRYIPEIGRLVGAVFDHAASHDVAIMDVSPNQTVVAQGASVDINVTAQNQGTNIETFGVTAYYYNATVTQQIGALQNVNNLAAGASKILTFTWSTIGVSTGSYTIKANASIVTDETDTAENIRIDGNVTVVLVHDVAIIDAAANRTSVAQGDIVGVNVTAQNQGHFMESFNVSALAGLAVIETKNVTNLAAGASTTLNFTWDTTLFDWGPYMIAANASIVTNETDVADNSYLDGTVQIISSHDVAIVGVSLNQTVVTPGASVGINVTAQNQGTYVENFTVSAYYYNATVTQQIGSSQNVNSLAPGFSRILNFTWSTIGVSLGNYTIMANASIVAGETVTADNTYIYGNVTIGEMDVGVTNVVACVDDCSCSIGEAYLAWTVNVTVTVENFGDSSATFTVSAYYNDTLIGTQSVIDLPAGQDANKTFSWNLGGVPLGLYTLKANVTFAGDTNPGNDEFVNGAFLVKLDGDVNGNRVVESGDLIFGLAPAIGSFPGDLNWNCQADFNFSGSVESGDLIFGFAPNNGSSY